MVDPKDPQSGNPKKKPTSEKAVIAIEPGTLVLIIALLILLPLLATGFISQ
ncbi:hypothetical protein [Nodosilinea sp. P-1105]|uniref:hypothetical protein n=1 Tax=Nodosilinea sp. P-1105 TaxID=2546229 RepID=UPI00146ACED6|nr:hypothetical protein [Nodosilinea sp. P-1105]